MLIVVANNIVTKTMYILPLNIQTSRKVGTQCGYFTFKVIYQLQKLHCLTVTDSEVPWNFRFSRGQYFAFSVRSITNT
jgi:hypothetical protein